MSRMPELWGGVECTVNRVGGQYFDQLKSTGHYNRESDLRLFSELGIRTLRFPILWECHVREEHQGIDWSWADKRLALARDLGIRPIVGFLHHGSGPLFTSLLDPVMPRKFAEYASRFAERYPWVDAYTPINEPLTTARFSGLYGHWYPHHRDEASFYRMLLNQCVGIDLAMKEIRKVNPQAELIQTEDLGRIFSTPVLDYQADHENERRWLTYDILLGRFSQFHPFWRRLLDLGLDDELLFNASQIQAGPLVLGVNHYITSNRFLDERLERYPQSFHGGNHLHRYADIEAVRIGAEFIAGPLDLIQEVWDRYRNPVAFTEVHMGCSHEEQMRWLFEVWSAACTALNRSIDVRGVTVWSLLGAFDWHNLVTRVEGVYESGVFDIRSGTPRPTPIARMVATYASGKAFEDPILHLPGWWRRPERLLYPPICIRPESGRLQLQLITMNSRNKIHAG